MSATLDKFMEKRIKAERKDAEIKGIKKGREVGREEGREEERVRSVKALLTLQSPEALLQNPYFRAQGYTQADIAAAMAAPK